MWRLHCMCKLIRQIHRDFLQAHPLVPVSSSSFTNDHLKLGSRIFLKRAPSYSAKRRLQLSSTADSALKPTSHRELMLSYQSWPRLSLNLKNNSDSCSKDIVATSEMYFKIKFQKKISQIKAEIVTTDDRFRSTCSFQYRSFDLCDILQLAHWTAGQSLSKPFNYGPQAALKLHRKNVNNGVRCVKTKERNVETQTDRNWPHPCNLGPGSKLLGDRHLWDVAAYIKRAWKTDSTNFTSLVIRRIWEHFIVVIFTFLSSNK